MRPTERAPGPRPDAPAGPIAPSAPSAPSAPVAPSALERQNRELAILNAIASGLNESVDLSASLAAALSRVAELLGLRTGWVWLLDERTGEPYLAAAQELPPGLRQPERMAGRCYCLDTFQRGDLNGAANVNVVTCSRLRWLAQEGTDGLRYHASIPLYAGGKKLGVMNLASPEWRRLSPDDLRLLHTIGELLGIAVERARLYARSAESGAIEERNRLAREIHDSLAQGLSATALQLETAEALLESGAERQRVGAALRRALEATRRNLEEARRSVLDLRAAPLEGLPLADALARLCAAAAGAPACIFEEVGARRPLPARVEAGLYRIAQEALGNAVRHAGAAHVRLRLVAEPERLTLTIEDDGAGFDPAAAPPDRFGLIGMRERARLLGGELHVQSARGAGTRVEVAIPLPGAPAPAGPGAGPGAPAPAGPGAETGAGGETR